MVENICAGKYRTTEFCQQAKPSTANGGVRKREKTWWHGWRLTDELKQKGSSKSEKGGL